MIDNPKSKFIVLDYNSEDDLIEWLKSEMSWEIERKRLVVYSYRDYPTFRMAHAKNLAHRLGMIEGGDILVNLDSDNYAGEGFEDWISDTMRPGVFLWAHMVKGEMTRGISGRIIVNAKAFHKVGGYDEVQFNTWGPDDKDFNLRLQALGYEPVEIPRPFLNSIPHNTRMRFKEYPHLKGNEPDYFHMDKSHIESTVANGGKIGLGKVFRNFDENDVIDVISLPTRIFGIGLHKTATTSLHKAMQILGYDSWHWPSAHSAKTVWREMNNHGYSRELERYHTLSDLPIPLLFRKLDKAYPGSKFILTRRDIKSWLKSLRRHYSYEGNKFRSAWDSDPFTHRIHNALYGTKEFNEGAMIRRYYQHASEVTEYFASRPSDLYVCYPDDGCEWDGLCGFLGIDNPEIAYPHAYVKQAFG